MMELIERQNQQNVCKYCDIVINDEEGTIMLQSTECFHTVHEACFKQRAKQSLVESSALYCPECANVVSNAEIKTYLTAEEVKAIEQT